jgi:WD40 repeat protein
MRPSMIVISATLLSLSPLFLPASAQSPTPQRNSNSSEPDTNLSSTAHFNEHSIEILPNVSFGSNISLAFSANLKHLLTGGSKGTAQLWDVESGRLVRIFKEKETATRVLVTAVAISPDGNRILAADRYGFLHVWDTLSAELLRHIDIMSFMSEARFIVTAAFLADGNFVTGGAGKVIIWSIVTGKPIYIFEGDGRSIALTRNGRLLALPASDGRSIQEIDLSTGQVVRLLRGQFGTIRTLAFSPDDTLLISGSGRHEDESDGQAPDAAAKNSDTTIRIWNASTGDLISSLTGHTAAVVSVAVSDDGTHIVSGSTDGVVKKWDLSTGQVVRSFDVRIGGGENTNILLSFGARFFAQMNDEEVTLWDVALGRPIRSFGSRLGGIMLVSGSDDRNIFLAAYAERQLYKIRLWDVSTGKVIRSVELKERPDGEFARNLIALSPDGKFALTGRGDEYNERESIKTKSYPVKLWDLKSGKAVRILKNYGHPVDLVAFAWDSFQALTSSADTTTLWDLKTGRAQWTIKTGAFCAAFSPDRKRVLLGDTQLRLLNSASGRVVKSFSQSSGTAIFSCAFSPNGKNVVAGNWDPEVLVYDVNTGQRKRLSNNHTDRIWSVSFSPDGLRILSASRDGTARVWEVSTGREIQTLPSDTGSLVTSAVFVPLGDRELTAHADGSLKLWKKDGGWIASLYADLRDEWLAITSAGFFAASNDGVGASDLLSVVRGLKTYAVSQFFDQLYHPDLVQEVLQGDPKLRHEDASHRLDLRKVLESGAPPEIQLVSSASEARATSVNIVVRLFNSVGGGIGKKLIWRVNGVVQGETEAPELQLLSDPSGPVIVSHGVRVDPNVTNVISVTAYNQAELFATEPLVLKVDRFGITEGPRAKMYVLGIAVDHYEVESGLPPLQFAAKDVRALAQALQLAGENGGYEKVEIVPPLIDQDAAREKIGTVFKQLGAIVNPWDTFVLILAGHGRSVAGRGFFYYPQNAKIGDGHTVLTDGIGSDQWRDWLAQVETTKRLLIIDTCESGEAVYIERGEAFNVERKSAIDRIREAVGHSVITASRAVAYEGNIFGHGLLSYAILQALGEQRPNDELVDIRAIGDHTEKEVPRLSIRLSGVEQRPYNKMVGNFPIGRPIALPSSVMAPVASCPTTDAEYFFARRERIRTRPMWNAETTRAEEPGYAVTVAEFIDRWVKICREGSPIGYVPHDALLRRR